ncbi:ComEC family competence protein [Prosthecochloris sp. CIB 2401]|nr:ComEC family competence protein [Prosthecochloris sp. CIB 2401]
MSMSAAPYPALRLLAGCCAGILCGSAALLPLPAWLLLALLSSLLVLSGSIRGVLSRTTFPSLLEAATYLVLVVSVFAFRTGYLLGFEPGDSLLRFAGRELHVYGKVVQGPKQLEHGQRWTMEASRVWHEEQAHDAGGRLQVYLNLSDSAGERVVEIGDMVWVRGTVQPLPEARNPADFDMRAYGRLHGVRSSVYLQGPWLLENHGPDEQPSLRRWFAIPLRHYLEAGLERLLPPGNERQFFRGILLGERDRLDTEVYDLFRNTGTAHVLAVSGLHVGLVVLIVLLPLQRLRQTVPGRWIVLGLVMFLLLLYTMVTGGAPSVRRASIMASVLLAGYTLGREAFPLNSLAVADLIILTINPLELYHPGFLMTNAAAASIIVLIPIWSGRLQEPGDSNWKQRARFLLQGTGVTLAAMVGVAPLVALYFGTFSPVALLANIPVVMLVSGMLYAILPALVCAPFAMFPAQVLADAGWFLAGAAIETAAFFSSLPYASINCNPPQEGVVLYYVILVALVISWKLQRWGPALTAIGIALNVHAWGGLFTASRATPAAVEAVRLRQASAYLFPDGTGGCVQFGGDDSPESLATVRRHCRHVGLRTPEVVIQPGSSDGSVGAGLSPSTFVLEVHDGLFYIIAGHRSCAVVTRLRYFIDEYVPRADVVLYLPHAKFDAESYLALQTWHAAVQPSLFLLDAEAVSGRGGHASQLIQVFAARHERAGLVR